MNIWDVEPNVFVIRLMRLVLERRSIHWTPERIYFVPQPYKKEDSCVENHILPISVALEKLSSIEGEWDAEEFEHLHATLGPNLEDFVDFFVNSVSLCYLKEYSPFNFMRYLRYIIDFSVFCFFRGYADALNFAAASMAHLIFKYEHVFTYFENWRKVINETARILRGDFLHPYITNTYFQRKSTSRRRNFVANRRRRC